MELNLGSWKIINFYITKIFKINKKEKKKKKQPIR